METGLSHMHFVATRAEAAELIDMHAEHWVSNCGCREERGRCGRSRMDVCLMFGDSAASGSGKRRITSAEARAILLDAERCRLVSRPFRNEARTGIDGICFCCDDCCGYFLNPAEVCDKGKLVEHTDEEACSGCGTCTDACYFGARTAAGDRCSVDREKCYGCGLCADVCPESCIMMVERAAG